AACARAHRPGVGAGVRLGQPEAADRVALVNGRKPALLLLLRAPAQDREHRERALHRDEASHPGVARLELHAGQPVGHGARARQAVALEVHAEEAELRHFLRELARQDALLEPFADMRHDTLAHPLPDGVPDRLLLVVEERVDREEVAWVERGLLRGGRHTRIVEDDYRAGASLASASESHALAYRPHNAGPSPPA